jgi:luciferase family oxidoreductase group 1
MLRTSPSGLALGVLDQSPISAGATAAEALQHTLELARTAEKLGYARYWVAEHHNTTGLAGPAPEVLVASIAAHTESIRVGSGGVMLPHYSSLKVAETFKLLEALHPGASTWGSGARPAETSSQPRCFAGPPPERTSRPRCRTSSASCRTPIHALESEPFRA